MTARSHQVAGPLRCPEMCAHQIRITPAPRRLLRADNARAAAVHHGTRVHPAAAPV